MRRASEHLKPPVSIHLLVGDARLGKARQGKARQGDAPETRTGTSPLISMAKSVGGTPLTSSKVHCLRSRWYTGTGSPTTWSPRSSAQ